MDLDGTITNSKLGITKSVQYALKHVNIYIDDLESLCKHIGPPLREAYIEYYGFSEEEAIKVIEKHREYFESNGLYENEVYDGVEQLLCSLKKAGKKIILATSKPEIYAKKILEYFHLDGYFNDICGATLDESRSRKEDVIRYALEKNEITDWNKVVMVGDRKYDIEGAKKLGIASIGVLYGFGSKEELEEAGADQIVTKVENLQDVLNECSL